MTLYRSGSNLLRIGGAMAQVAGASGTFPNDENPISQGGIWDTGGSVGLDWTNPKTLSGRAQSSALIDGGGVRYNDALCSHKTTYHTYNNNQSAQGTVYKFSGYAPTDPHEIELLLRWQITTNVARGYEVLWGVQGYLAIVRWNGSLGSYTTGSVNGGGAYAPGTFPVPADGDVLFASIVGTTLIVKVNGSQVASIDVSSDFGGGTVWNSGQPGMGFWPVNETAGAHDVNIDKLGWKVWTPGDL